METATRSNKMVESDTPQESENIALTVGQSSLASTATPRETILSTLCEEIRQGRLNKVNSLFGPYGFSVNPEFLKSKTDRLRIMQDIEVALNEFDEEPFLLEFSATET